MKLLLTSGGVSTPAIEAELVSLLGRPIRDARALLIATAQHGHPWCSPTTLWNATSGDSAPMVSLGWKSVGVLELLALPYIARERWISWLDDTDALLVDGGSATFLAHVMRDTGFEQELAARHDLVWVGLSAGSMVATPRIGKKFCTGWSAAETDTTLGWVDFSIFPHLDHPDMPTNTVPAAEEWAATIGGPAYALNDQSAISVVDGDVKVISDADVRYWDGGNGSEIPGTHEPIADNWSQ